MMNAILHGTWITSSDGKADELFFVWAERVTRGSNGNGPAPRIPRHPYAATTIEIAELLATYVPDVDWSRAERLTRVALLPSTSHAPVAPRWLAGKEDESEDAPRLSPWRIEGIGIPILQMLDVLAALPVAEGGGQRASPAGRRPALLGPGGQVRPRTLGPRALSPRYAGR